MNDNTEQMKIMPVNRLSHSSLMDLLRNPLIFKMKHVLGIFETRMGVSGMIGRAVHHALKLYYGGEKDIPVPFDKAEAQYMARDHGMQFLNDFPDSEIEYGKTGSREDMLKGYTQALDFYFAEEPDYHEVLICEEKLASEITTIYGDLLPLPATGIPDLVVRERDGTVTIIDNKIVTSFTTGDTEDYVKILQGEFLFHLLIAAKKIKADRIVFREIKRTKNKDGSPQVQDWEFPFSHEPYHIIFYNLFNDAVKFLSNPNAVYLPNLGDTFNGEHAGLIYAQGLINADMSDVEVMHKVKDVALVSKKFVASKLDNVENKHLLPEEKIKVRLAEFGIPVEPVETVAGAAVTQYRFKVSAGIAMSRFKKHSDDIALAIEAKGAVNIIAPIPGTNLVGVEVANESRTTIKIADEHFVPNTLSLPIGDDIQGNAVTMPLNEMPHLLVAGTTGSGKSFLLHNFIKALTTQMPPEDMKLVLIDPKRVELSKFKAVPHLMGKILYEYEDSLRMLLQLVDEMERRYKVLENAGKTNITEYNTGRRNPENRLPYIVIVIDEFADFMQRARDEKKKSAGYSSMTKTGMLRELVKRAGGPRSKIAMMNDEEEIEHVSVSSFRGADRDAIIDALERNDATDPTKSTKADIEKLIVRLAQMARAVGIHLIIATQSPRADVITGLIKANISTRIALTVASATESVIILDKAGAEKLNGKGDMLFTSPGRGEVRLQGYHT